jgi:GAF domain-containing protein
MNRIRSSPATPAPPGKDFLAGGGEQGERIRTLDWSKTAVGPVAMWPQSLKITVRIMLTSRYAMWMGWGRDLTFFCNDAYRPTLGIKDAWALGASAREVWAEIWPDIGPRAEAVLRTGVATWDEGLLLFLERSGFAEETYHTFSYSPVPDDQGGVGGMLCVVTEDTERTIGERRLALLRELASGLATTHTEDEVFAALHEKVSAEPRDLPFALTYLFDADGKRARLASAIGVAAGSPVAPARLDLAAAGAPWPARPILSGGVAVTLGDPSGRFGALPTGPWDKPARQAVVIPIAHQGQDRPAGFLVAGINPYRPLDAAYRGFLDLLAGQIASGLANARAHEEERRRARGARPRQDRLLQQRQPRVPHAADADPRAGGGRARRARARARRRRSRVGPPQRAPPAQAGQLAPRLLAHRGRARAGVVRAHRSVGAHRRSGERVPLRDRARRARVRGRVPAALGAGLRRPRHVGEDRAQPALERAQVYPFGRLRPRSRWTPT